MNYRFNLILIGNHWYVDIDHEYPTDIALDEKVEKYLNLINKNKSKSLCVELDESYTVIDDDTIFFNNDDVFKYLTTEDDFDMRIYVRDHEFKISSALYNTIETYCNNNFYNLLYKIEIFDWTI